MEGHSLGGGAARCIKQGDRLHLQILAPEVTGCAKMLHILVQNEYVMEFIWQSEYLMTFIVVL